MSSGDTKRSHLVLKVLAVLAILVCIVSLDETLPLSPFATVALDGPIEADSNGPVSAIADNAAHRVLVLNKNHEVTRIISFDVADAPVDVVTDVCVSDNVVYVAGANYKTDTDLIVRERVLAYGRFRSHAQVLYEREGPNSSIPAIKALNDAEDGVILTLVEEPPLEDMSAASSTSKVIVLRVDGTGSEEIERSQAISLSISAGCNSAANRVVLLSSMGQLYDMGEEVDEVDGGMVFTALDVSDDNEVYAAEDHSGSLYRIDSKRVPHLVMEGSGLRGVHVNRDTLAVCDREQDSVVIRDLNGENSVTLSEVRLSAVLSCFVALLTLCRVYLVVLAVVLATQKLRHAYATGDTKGLGGLFAALALVVAAAISVAYNAYGTYQVSLKTRANEIDALADILTERMYQPDVAAGLSGDRDVLRKGGAEASAAQESWYDVILEAGVLVDAASNNGIGSYCVVYGEDEEGIYYLYDSSLEFVMGTSSVSALVKDDLERMFNDSIDDTELHTGRSLRDNTLFRLVRIPSSDGKGTVGVIEIGSRVRSFESSVMKDLTHNGIALLVVLLVVFIVYAELRACGHCLVEYRQLREGRAADAVAALTRPYTFVITTLISTDAVMSTLIGRSLLSEAGIGEEGFLLALPAVMQGIGHMAGQSVYGYLGSRVSSRRLIVSFAVLLIASAAAAAVAVGVKGYALYCVTKLLMGIPFGLLYTLGYSLPRQAKSDRVRALGSGGVRRTDTSAAAMGTILGGFVAQTLGNEWVYVLVAVGGFVVIAMAVWLFVRGDRHLEHEHPHQSRILIMRSFLAKRSTLFLVLGIMLPAILASGYNSFLFPLYSADLGVDSSTISRMFVLGQLVVYVCIDALDTLDVHYGKWWVAVGSVALLGVVFLLFSLNTSLTWAVVVIALVGVFCKAADAWKALWTRGAQASGIPVGTSTGAMFAMRSVLQIVQPLLLGALLSMSRSVAAIVLGGLCLLCAALFFVNTRRSDLRTKGA